MPINVPNQVTLARLVLVVVLFCLLSCFDAAQLDRQRWLLQVCFWVFIVAALGDILDGLLARWMKSETPFGRVVDPVVDKVMVCGVFVLFAGVPFWNGQRNVAGVQPWMVIIILTRELLVSAIRTHVESEGQEFGASWSGKLKMFLQCTAIGVVLGQLAWNLESLAPVRTAAVWLAVIVTTLSAVTYVHRARAFLLASQPAAGRKPTRATAITGRAADLAGSAARNPASDEAVTASADGAAGRRARSGGYP